MVGGRGGGRRGLKKGKCQGGWVRGVYEEQVVREGEAGGGRVRRESDRRGEGGGAEGKRVNGGV